MAVESLQIAGCDFELIVIANGEYLMGSDRGLPLELPAHRVRIDASFCIGRTPVTQQQWRAVMGTNPSAFGGEAHLPVGARSNHCASAERLDMKSIRSRRRH